jgi:hypothetical protein
VYISKPDGGQRLLAVAALGDKIIQRAAAAVLNAIYEEDFLGVSYGFRPGRGAHDAMDALVVAIERKKVNHIVDADIRSFFDSVSHERLIEFVQRRIADKRMIRLIQKWLKVGVLEDGIVSASERGSEVSPSTEATRTIADAAAPDPRRSSKDFCIRYFGTRLSQPCYNRHGITAAIGEAQVFTTLHEAVAAVRGRGLAAHAER